jgi:hypothetical protein
MKLETVSAVTMGDLVRKVLGQVDDFNGVKGASFDAHTATDAEMLRNEANSGSRFNLNTEFASLVNRARLGALLLALLGLALIRVNDSDS